MKTGHFHFARNRTLSLCLDSWLLFGSIIFFWYRRRIHRNNCARFVLFYLLAFSYINILRERVFYGDVFAYVNAAFDLFYQKPLEIRYLYPPLFATCLQLFVPLGRDLLEILCFGANYFSLLLFIVLLYRFLTEYHFSKNMSMLLVFICFVVNDAILRNMVYTQVNVHVINCILLCCLYYKKNVVVSALALSIAVHIKVVPLVFVLSFVLNKDWKWLRFFVLSNLFIVLMTSLINNASYYSDFVANIIEVQKATGVLNFRENSIDSFVAATRNVFDLGTLSNILWVLIPKLIFLIVSVYIMAQSILNQVYISGPSHQKNLVFNSFIPLLFLMVILSPLVWVHHLVFVIPSCLIIIKRISTVKEVLFFSFAYYLLFLVPTFDFYPFSYHRLVGILLFYVLLTALSRKKRDESNAFINSFNDCLEKIT